MTTKRAIRGTGSVFHEPARNRYRGKVTIDGETFTVYARTKTEARRKLNEVIRSGGRNGDPTITVAQVMTTFLERSIPDRDRPLAPATVELHRWAAEKVTTYIGAKKADKLRPADVEAMLDTLAADGMAKSSLRAVRSTLSTALEFAIKRGDITRNATRGATLPATAKPATDRTALTPAQARILLAELRHERNGLMFALGLKLGLRPGEASALYWSDVTDDAVNVTRGRQRSGGRTSVADELKTRKSKRAIGLPADLVDWFRDHRRDQAAERLAAETWGDERLVFCSPTGNLLDPSNDRRQLTAICERIEQRRREDDPDGDPFPRVTPHELRHSCASLLSDEGVPLERIADLLGHTTTDMLEQTYRHRVRPTIDVAARATWAADA